MPGEPWTDARNVIVEAGGFLRITPVNVSSGNENEIASLGTKEDFLKTTCEIDIYSNSVIEKTEYKYKALANGTILRVEKLSPMIDAASGLKVSKDNNSVDKFHVRLLAGKYQKDLIIDWVRNGRALMACISLGINAMRVNTGFAHLLCRIGGEIKEERQDDISELSFVLMGGRAYTVHESVPGTPDINYSNYNAVAAGGGNQIEPVGKSAITIKPIGSAEWSVVLSGRIARTDNS